MQAPNVIKRNPVVCALALLAAVVMLFISEGSYRQAVNTLDDLGHTAAARMNLQRLERGVLDAEASQMGYLLSDRSQYLEPYASALRAADESLQQLDRYYVDAEKTREPMARLRALTESRLSILAETLRLYREGKPESAKELVLSGLGLEKMQAIRQLGAELLAHESKNVTEGRASVYQTLLISRIGVAALIALMLLALYLYLRHGTKVEMLQQENARLSLIERDRLEVEVGQRTAELTDLTRHLMSAREDERNRLARDLHDELGSLLTSAKLDAARIKTRLGDGFPEAQERLVHLVTTLNTGIALGRRIIEDLRPSTLANLGLVAALEILARDFAAQSRLQVHCALTPVRLSAAAELVVYRFVQEGVTNLSKHAKASQVWIGLDELDGHVEASVRDDGTGFDTTNPPASTYGLLGMRYRAEAEQGRLAVVSATGQGTTVSLSLPIAT